MGGKPVCFNPSHPAKGDPIGFLYHVAERAEYSEQMAVFGNGNNCFLDSQAAAMNYFLHSCCQKILFSYFQPWDSLCR